MNNHYEHGQFDPPEKLAYRPWESRFVIGYLIVFAAAVLLLIFL
jgi:hypothetical protein